MVLAMAAPAMAGERSWKSEHRGKDTGHGRYVSNERRDYDKGDRRHGDRDHRWSDWRRGDDDRHRGHDWRRDGRDGDWGRRYGDRDHPGRHLGHREHDNDKHDTDKHKNKRDKDKHDKDKWQSRHDGRGDWRDGRWDGHRGDWDRKDGRDWRQTWYGGNR
jgi:hypothetical protein